ncbi:MAG: hypothetical protein JSV40_12285 [Deltaproteobacteria bacterium]|nr:MAG: hypothetical protein JSV40_12285 [Deltaproteobacteria bacterium]
MSKHYGLVFAYVLDGKGGREAIDWRKLRQWFLEQGTLWFHFDYASEKAQSG